MPNNAVLTLTKYSDFFPDRETGQRVEFQYLEIEFAPNCYAKFSLKNSNLHALEKYNPDMYQLIMNIPAGTPVQFIEHWKDEDNGTEASSITDIYKNNDVSDDEDKEVQKNQKRIRIF